MNHLFRIFALFVAGFLCLSQGAPGYAAAGPDPALARYRGGAVTRSEFEGYQRWRSGDEGYQQLLRNPEAVRGEIRRLAVLKITTRLAEEAGLQRSEEFLSRLRKYENELLAARWRRQISNRVSLASGEFEKMLPTNLEEELDVYWAALPTREEAASFSQSLRGGAKFQDAVAASRIPTGSYGESTLTAHGETHFSASTRAVIMRLAPGQVSEPCEEPIGYYVIEAVRVVTAKQQREGLVAQTREKALAGKRAQALAAALKTLRERAKIVINEAGLANPALLAPGKSVAEVNGEPVTIAQEPPHGFPEHGGFGEILRDQLDKYIDEILAAQEARRLGLGSKDPAFAAAVRYQAIEIIAEIYRTVVGDRFTVTEEEARKYLAENAKQFQTDAMVRFAHIVLHSEFLAAKYRQELISGKSTFEDLAKRLSEDRDSSERGGELGWFIENTLKEPFKSAVEHLRVGEISLPVSSSERYILLKLEERLEPKPLAFEAVKDKVMSRALLAKRTDAYQDFVARKLKEDKVELDEQQIARLRK